MAKLPVVRLVEDAVLVAGVAVSTWQSTGDASAVVAAVVAAPVARSGLALLLSAGESSGLVEGLGILRRALALLRSTPYLDLPPAVFVPPTPAQTPSTGHPGATPLPDPAA